MAGQRMAVFFDIGDTLASPVVAGGRLTALDVYPRVPEVLDRLAAHGGLAVSPHPLHALHAVDTELHAPG